ncbi:MAG: energy transducer TonB [Deltaproteobacteria bacterium]|nr:energy transducer TonB [Deltaproteobacteria bacterium]
MIGLGRAGGKPLRFSFFLIGAVWISIGIFALVPLLLRQTSYQPHFPRASYALLIPIKPELPVDAMRPDQNLEPPPEAPDPPEPKIEAEMPDVPEIAPPEVKPPKMALPETVQETLDLPPVETTTLETPSPDPPQIQTPSLHAISLSALPVQPSPMNLKVSLKVGKAPVPKAVARLTVPQKPVQTRTRFGLNEVDQKPVSIATLRPPYPFRARRMGIEGYVVVQFLVDREGTPRDVSIVDAKPGDIFNQAVRRTVPRWRFKPGKKAGRPVDTWVKMTIRFDLN